MSFIVQLAWILSNCLRDLSLIVCVLIMSGISSVFHVICARILLGRLSSVGLNRLITCLPVCLSSFWWHSVPSCDLAIPTAMSLVVTSLLCLNKLTGISCRWSVKWVAKIPCVMLINC